MAMEKELSCFKIPQSLRSWPYFSQIFFKFVFLSEKKNKSILDNGLEERWALIRCSSVLRALHIITDLPTTSKYEVTFNFHVLILYCIPEVKNPDRTL